MVLAVGVPQRVAGTELTLTVEAIDDSRCPVGANCVWAGDVTVRIDMRAPNAEPSVVSLRLSEKTTAAAVYRGTKIRLVSVTPTPAATGTVKPEDYRVTVLVEQEEPHL